MIRTSSLRVGWVPRSLKQAAAKETFLVGLGHSLTCVKGAEHEARKVALNPEHRAWQGTSEAKKNLGCSLSRGIQGTLTVPARIFCSWCLT